MSTSPNNIKRNALIALLSAFSAAIFTSILFACGLLVHYLLCYVTLTTVFVTTTVILTLVIYFMSCRIADSFVDEPSPMIGHHDTDE